MNVLLALGAIALFIIGSEKSEGSDSQVSYDEPENIPVSAWNRFDDLFEKYGDMYGVPRFWLKAIAMNESDLGRAKSVARGLIVPTDIEGSKSSDGLSWGLMQVTLKTGKWLDATTTVEKLNDPDFSVYLSAMYLSQLQNQFSRNDSRFDEWVIKSYNQGPGNTKREMVGAGGGYANTYWERFQRNLNKVAEAS